MMLRTAVIPGQRQATEETGHAPYKETDRQRGTKVLRYIFHAPWSRWTKKRFTTTIVRA